MMIVKKSSSVKLGKEKILACLTCPICENLFVDATTISECLHTFCRKCIYGKIADEELNQCPVCNIHLGSVPLDKLRVDHNLQDLRAKIFAFETKIDNASGTVASAPLPARRKERSLSSLVVTAPRASPQSCPTRRRKYPIRKSLVRRGESALPNHKPVTKAEDCPEKFSSSVNIAANGKPVEKTSTNDSYKRQVQNDNVKDNGKPFEGNSDMLKPLISLVETPSKTKANKANLQEPTVESVSLDGLKSEVQEPKVRVKKQGKRPRVHGGQKQKRILKLQVQRNAERRFDKEERQPQRYSTSQHKVRRLQIVNLAEDSTQFGSP